MSRKCVTDPIANYARKSVSARRIGVGRQCACGENRPEALVPKSEPIMCARCKRKKEDKSTVDQHHVAGTANSEVTVPVDVNDHRAELNVAQENWEKPILSNPNGCPVISVAGKIRGVADTHIYLLEQLMIENPTMLVALSEFLEKKLGPNWWVGTPLEKYSSKR